MLRSRSILFIVSLSLLTSVARLPAQEADAVTGDTNVTNVTAIATSNVTATASNNSADEIQTLRALLILQEQVRQTQKEVEETRLEADVASKRTAEILAARLNLIEQTLTVQRQREFEALQGSNQLLLIVVGVIAAVGFLSIAFSSWLQTRAVNRLSQVSEQLRIVTGLPGPAAYPQLPGGENSRVHAPPHPASTQLMTTIGRIEKRIEGIEQPSESATNGHTEKPRLESATPVPTNAQIATLIARGQSLLNGDQPAEALACFEEVLKLDEDQVEAWIKKGTALERLQRSDEAIAAYDRAIAIDGSIATAYLFKAGVFNRQKRYAEALQCYEKALSVQKSRSAAVAA